MIQLRGKKTTRDNFLEMEKKARAIIDYTSPDIKLIVNDNIEICIKSKANGVHLGQEDTPIAKARDLLGSDYIIGLSTHSIEQITQSNLTDADYLGFGPIFSTATKENPSPTVGIEILKTVAVTSNKPIVAIGGIDSKNVKAIFDSGINSVAIIGDLEKEFWGNRQTLNEYICRFAN
jgi:thiamine-phosphate pyrophosphorylase